MKQARQIIIPDDGVITKEEYEDYYKHAKNSSIWYLSRYDRNSNQIREKLYKKGYSKDAVIVMEDDNTKTEKNIVEDVIKYLTDLSFIDDREYAVNTLNSYLKKGKGLSLVKSILIYDKKIDAELLNEILDETDEIDEIERIQIEKTALKVINSSTYKKKDKYKKKQFLYQRLSSKGFNSNTIKNWLDDNIDLMEVEDYDK